MTVKVAINGFGRIGRNVLRAIVESGRTDIEVVAINDLGPVETNAHLLRFDSVHGRFPHEVKVDGDTIDVDIAGKTYRVRYIGMDTPEATTSVEYFGPEATMKNKELVDGKTVLLVKDVSEIDRYGRLLRYVWLPPAETGNGWELVNLDLLRLGVAQVAQLPVREAGAAGPRRRAM